MSSPAGRSAASAAAWPDHSDVNDVSPVGSAAGRSGSTAPPFAGTRASRRQRADLTHQPGHDAAGRASGEHVGERRFQGRRAAQRIAVQPADRGFGAQQVAGADLRRRWRRARTRRRCRGRRRCRPPRSRVRRLRRRLAERVPSCRPGVRRRRSVRNMPRCPPASAPWAMTASQPCSASHRASGTVVAEAITRAPVSRTRSRRSSARQPEVEADDFRPQLLDDSAASVVERDDRHVGRAKRH